ncbi:dCTP pyrophosphatase [Escherichia coli]|nr:dCTP pyrophosphatase [Escherichia coli]
MSEFNSCAHLVNAETLNFAEEKYKEIIANGDNPFQHMMNMQKALQDQVSKDRPWVAKIDELKTCGEILDFIRANDNALDDETRELYTALGGMSNGKDASAVWKHWKANHMEARNRLFSDLPEADRLETYLEAVDQLHFIMCKFLALGLTAKDLFVLYMLKNAENYRRLESGY